MARRIWGKRQGADGKQHMGRLQQTLALLAVLGAGVAIAALLGGSGYALTLVTGGTTDTTPRSLQAAGPTIESDQPDYNPGATVVLTGHNWADSEAVHVAVNDDKGQTWSYSDDVTADANGDFSLHFVLPTSFVATYAAVATGAMSGTAR